MRTQKLIVFAGMLLFLGAGFLMAQASETDRVQIKQTVQNRACPAASNSGYASSVSSRKANLPAGFVQTREGRGADHCRHQPGPREIDQRG